MKMGKTLILAKLKARAFSLGYTIFLMILVMLAVFIYSNNKTKLLKENENHFLDKIATLESIISKNIDITLILSNIFNQYSNQKITKQTFISLNKTILALKKNNANKNYFTISPNSTIENLTTFNTFIGSGNTNGHDEKYLQKLIAILHLQDFQKSAHQQIKSLVASYYMSFTPPDNILSFYPYVPADKILANYNSFTQFTNEALAINNKQLLPAIHKKTPYFWSEPYLDPAGNGMMVSCSVPIYKGQQLDAIIGTDITLSALNKYVNKTNNFKSQNYIVSQKGYIITGNNINYQQNDDLILFDDLLIKLGGKDKFILNQQTLKNAPWQFISLISKKSLIKQNLFESRYYNIFFLFSAIAALISYYLINNNFIRPGVIAEKKLKQSNIELSVITKELKEKISDLQSAQQKIIEAEKLASLATLVTGIAHEINTPAGIAITANSLIYEKTFELQQAFDNNKLSKSLLKNYLAQTNQSSYLLSSNLARVAELIKDFQSISPSSSENKLSKFNFKDYLFKITSVHENLYKKDGHNIRIHCNDITLETYKNIFNQIILTLLENTVRHGFNQRKNGLIEIVFSELEEYYQLSYSDNGTGINNTVKNKIFDPFYTSDRGQGKGLGLFAIHNIIKESLQGEIIIDDAKQKTGICFVITWPKIQKP
jgi:signal transduction histidine kinase